MKFIKKYRINFPLSIKLKIHSDFAPCKKGTGLYKKGI